ncbi:DUF2914 domain-containing protein [Caminibacter pacificus]|uniref:DUF2914 domain-containing protein n=1 Tax=Caminibacter pacificus TaxID=1424653 RepID=A0AAJ4RCE8_9BACT|nr:DUF2914 domain-containing protein [Caminibacter pacificus]QCI28018.1 DUF2914 domain-containing protein [Caminibacter pacificus]ROR39794.1 DUF2914 family protein [Caminibacter pacificus]
MKKLLLTLLAVIAFAYDIKEFVTCKKVVDLTPQQITDTFTTKDKKVYAFAYFTNIKENRLIDFVWEKNVNGVWKIYADVQLPIYTGSRWRTYSTINIQPCFVGKWRVSIVDNDQVVDSKEFNITDENTSE